MSFQYQYQTGHKGEDKIHVLDRRVPRRNLGGALAVGSMDLYAKMYKPMPMDTNQIEAPDCQAGARSRNRTAAIANVFKFMPKKPLRTTVTKPAP